jgi:DNA-binding response OmpR family regulator
LLVEGRRIGLTRLEFGVMQYLVEREGKAVSRSGLLSDVWGYAYEGGSNVVDAAIRSLRKKLGQNATQIETVSGVGYRYRSAGSSLPT